MKTALMLLFTLLALFFISCHKEELFSQKEGSLSKENKSLLFSGTEIKKKTLKAHLVAKETPFAQRAAHTSLVFKDKMWVIAGTGPGLYYNDAWCSADGVNWIEANIKNPFSERQQHTSVFYDKKLWIIAGYALVNGNSSDYFSDVWSLE